jgi:hypothetical protein
MLSGGTSLGMTGPLTVALGLALWMTAGAWGNRPPSGEDTLAHLVRAEFALRELFPRGRLDGWHPGFILGYQEFLFIGPGFTWAVALVRVASLGQLSVAGAFKVVFIGSFVLLPLSVAFFARSFGLSRRGAGIAGILTLAVNNPFGVGTQGLFNVGLVVHQFGASFFFLTLGGVARLLEQPRLKWVLVSGTAGAALLVSHGISVILLAPLIAIIMVVRLLPAPSADLRSKRIEVMVRREVQAELRRLGASPAPNRPTETTREPASPTAEPSPTTDDHQSSPSRGQGDGDLAAQTDAHSPELPRIAWGPLFAGGLLAAALAACTLLPFLAHRNLQTGFTGWGTPPIGQRVQQILEGDIMFRPGVTQVVLIGLAFGVYRSYKGHKYALTMVIAPIAYLVVSHAALNLWPSVVTVQLPNRGVGYVGILAMLPLSALIDRVASPRAAGSIVAVLVAALIVILPSGPLRELARQTNEPAPAMEEAALALSRLVPDGARFVTERDFPREIERTRVVNPDRWLAWASGRNTLNNFNVESSTTGEAAFESEHIRNRSAEQVAASLSRLGTTHLVTVSDEGSAHIGSSSRFRRVWAEEPLTIFEVLPEEGQPEPAALLTADVPVRAQLIRAEPEQVEIDFQASASGRARVAIAWSPKWHARLDGEPFPVSKGLGGLLEIAMPAGDHRLELQFRPDVWDRLGLVISVSTVLGVAFILLRRRRALAAAVKS